MFFCRRRGDLLYFYLIIYFLHYYIAICVNLFNSNDGNDDNQIRQMTINGMVATSSTGRRTPQANYQHQLAISASNISG